MRSLTKRAFMLKVAEDYYDDAPRFHSDGMSVPEEFNDKYLGGKSIKGISPRLKGAFQVSHFYDRGMHPDKEETRGGRDVYLRYGYSDRDIKDMGRFRAFLNRAKKDRYSKLKYERGVDGELVFAGRSAGDARKTYNDIQQAADIHELTEGSLATGVDQDGVWRMIGHTPFQRNSAGDVRLVE